MIELPVIHRLRTMGGRTLYPLVERPYLLHGCSVRLSACLDGLNGHLAPAIAQLHHTRQVHKAAAYEGGQIQRFHVCTLNTLGSCGAGDDPSSQCRATFVGRLPYATKHVDTQVRCIDAYRCIFRCISTQYPSNLTMPKVLLPTISNSCPGSSRYRLFRMDWLKRKTNKDSRSHALLSKKGK